MVTGLSIISVLLVTNPIVLSTPIGVRWTLTYLPLEYIANAMTVSVHHNLRLVRPYMSNLEVTWESGLY